MVKSKTVMDCKNMLNATTVFTPVHLIWVKAHATSAGNNWVDLLAKEGAQTHARCGPFPHDTVTLAFVRSVLQKDIMDEWKAQWQAHPTCRQTKLFFPEPIPPLSRKILQLKRPEIGRLIRWITGHNFLRRHWHLIDPQTYSSERCRLCNMEPETSLHIIAECMALDFNRLKTLKCDYMNSPYQWKLRQLNNFLAEFADLLEEEGPVGRISILTRTGSRTLYLEKAAVPLDPLLQPWPIMRMGET